MATQCNIGRLSCSAGGDIPVFGARVFCMRLIVLLAAFAAIASAAQGAPVQDAWTTLGHDAQHTGLSSAIGPLAPSNIWSYETNVWASLPLIAKDGTICLICSSYLYAINPDGTLRWKSTDPSFYDATMSIGPDGTVYVATPDADFSDITAINSDGTVRWALPQAANRGSVPAVGADGTLYVNCGWCITALKPNGDRKWYADGIGRSSPAIGRDGTIYCCGEELCALNKDGTQKWSLPLAALGTAPPTVAPDGTIYVTSETGTLYAVRTDGSKKWEFSGGVAPDAPAVGPDGTIYVCGTDTDSIIAINSDGSKRWGFAAGTRPDQSPSIDAQGTIYFTVMGALYALNPDGSEKWATLSSSLYYGSPAIGPDGSLYLRQSDNLVRLGPGRTPTPPSISIRTPSPSVSSGQDIYYGINYSDATSVNLTDHDIILHRTGTANGTPVVSGSGIASRTVTITNVHGAGTLSISIAAGSASNATGSAVAAGPGQAVGVDSTHGGRGDWWMSGHDPQHTNRSSYTGPAVPYVLWTKDLAVSDSPAISSDGTLFVPTNNGIAAVRPDGSSRWTNTTMGWSGVTPTLGVDGTVYTADNSFARAISPNNIEWWRACSGDHPWSTSIGSDGAVYCACSYGLCALSPDGSTRWTYDTGGSYGETLAVGRDGRIYVGAYDGFCALNPNGTLYWKYSLGLILNGGWGNPTVGADGTIYVCHSNGSFCALDPCGKLKWKVNTPSNGRWSYAALGLDGTIYLQTPGIMYAIDPNGATKWSFRTSSGVLPTDYYYSPTVGADGTVYVSSTDGKLHALNPDGRQKWEYASTAGMFLSPVLGADGTLYAGTLNGKLYAIGSNPSLPPTVSISKPILPDSPNGAVTYVVSYPGSTSVSLRASDIRLNKTGTASAIVSVSGAGNTRVVTLSRLSGHGTLSLSIVARTASNRAGFAPAIGPSDPILVGLPPVVTVGAPSAGETARGPVNIPINYFGADIVTLKPDCVKLNRTGTATGKVRVSGGGKTTRTVTVYDTAGEGTLSISIIRPTAMNISGLSLPAGPSAPFYVVNTAPHAWIGDPSVRITKSGPVEYVVTYTRASLITLKASDVHLDRTGTANGLVTVSNVDATHRKVTISGITGEGTLGIWIDERTASSAAGYAPATPTSVTVLVRSAQ